MDYSYNTIKPVGGSDVPITTNPSYDVHTKPYSKTSEDEYNYVQPNEFTDSDGYIKIHATIDQSCTIKTIHSPLTASSAEQDEYGIISQPHSEDLRNYDYS